MHRAARGAAWRAARAPPARFCRAPPPLDTAALRELRRRTGLPLLRCRDALLRCGGALPQAEAWLQEQARQQGWSSAPPSGPPPAQGLLGLLREGPAAVMVEVNCDTDFVARTPQFRRLVELAALGAMERCRRDPPATRERLLGAQELAELRVQPGGGLLSDHLALGRAQLGERLTLRRAACLRVPAQSGFIGAYAHGPPPPPPTPAPPDAPPVALGTYGALVAFEVSEPRPPPDALEAAGRGVAQHVVGLAPRSLGTPGARPRGEGETRLLAQGFVLDPALTVAQFLRERAGGALAVRRFLRFRCGEEGGGLQQDDEEEEEEGGEEGETPAP